MFNQKKVTKVLKEYKEQGVVPSIFDEDIKSITDINQVAFLMLLEKSIDLTKKDLKTFAESKLTAEGLKTDLLTITYKNGYISHNVSEDGKEYLRTNMPQALQERQNKASYIWKLR